MACTVLVATRPVHCQRRSVRCIYPNSSVPTWQASHAYTVGQLAGITGDTALMLVCKQAGTSGTTMPTTSGGVGTRVNDPPDGTGAVWQVASRTPFSILTSSQTINGAVIQPGMYVDGAMIVNATVNNAQIANAAIDDAKISSVTLAKIASGSLTVGQSISSSTQHDYGSGMEPDWRIDGNGTATFNTAVIRGTVYATDGNFTGEVNSYGVGGDRARLYYGNVEIYKAVPSVGTVLYKSLSRVEYGTANNNTLTTIPGYFKSQPKIIVSPNSMQFYKAANAAQDQSVVFSASAPVETSTGSMVWQFTPVAQLVLGASAATTVVNQSSSATTANSWTSSNYTTAANTTTITPTVTIASNRGDGGSQYVYRTVRWRVEYFNGTSWITGSWNTTALGADTAAQASNSAGFSFPSAGTWTFRIYCEAADTSPYAVFGAVTYDYSTATITHSGSASQSAYSGSSPASATLAYNNGTYTPTAPWTLDPANTYSTVYTYDYSISAGNSFYIGRAYVTDPNGTSYDTGSVRGGSQSGSSISKTKVSNTNANLSFSLYAEGWSGSSGVSSAFVNALSAVTTVKLRKPQANSTTPSNTYTFGSYGYTLSTATTLATGTLNWIAIGD